MVSENLEKYFLSLFFLMTINLSEYGLNSKDEYYEGIECKKCHEPYKYKKNPFKGKCVVCFPRLGTQARARKQLTKYKRSSKNPKYYQVTTPCTNCGSLLRYRSNNGCAQCVTTSARDRYHHKKLLEQILGLKNI